MNNKLIELLKDFDHKNGNITILTGAGISAESGIPTFRGSEGYWTIDSINYRPEEMATNRMFNKHPYDVWQWYLYRKTICNSANPNKGHYAVAQLESIFKDRFCLITQNVDGIHIRAGNSLERTYMIHGNIDYMRCSKECSTEIFKIPSSTVPKTKEDKLTVPDIEILKCPKCHAISRPHILWFDECYDEHFYRFESSLKVAKKTDLLIVIGTSGATNLPMQVGNICYSNNAILVDINPDHNPFSKMAEESIKGCFFEGNSSDVLPDIINYFSSKEYF